MKDMNDTTNDAAPGSPRRSLGSRPVVTGFSAAVTLMTAILAGAAHGQGMPALLPTGTAGLSAAAPPAGLAAVRADGRADDTAAIQAQVHYALNNSHPPILLPPGLIKLTSPLVVGSVPASYTGPALFDIEQGWCLQGSGPPAIQPTAAGAGGACLFQAGRNQPAVIEFDRGGWRRSQLTNVALFGNPSAAAGAATRYGLWNNGWTRWSALTLRGVLIQNVGTGIALTGPADGSGAQGGNGEELNCYDCQIDARNTVFLSSTPYGQAKPQSWYGVEATTRVPGGEAFVFGGTGKNGLGGNFCDFGSSLTMAHVGAYTTSTPVNTFIMDYGAENVCFVGGRDEHVGTVVSWVGSGSSATGVVSISGHTFAGMNGYAPFLKSAGAGGEQIKVLLTGDSFTSYAATPLTIGIAPHSTASVVLTDCDFDGWTDYSALTASPRLTLVRCRARTKPTEPYAPLISGAAPTAHLVGPAPKAPLPGLRAAAKPRLGNIAEISLFAAPIAGCVLFFLTRSVGRTSS